MNMSPNFSETASGYIAEMDEGKAHRAASPRERRLKARSLYAKRDFNAAAAMLIDALDHPADQVFRARCLAEAGRAETAIAVLRDAIAAWPDFGRSHLALARLLAAAGDLAGATRAAAEACRLEPNAPSGTLFLGSLHLRGGDPERAIAAYAAAADLDASSAPAFSGLALAYERLQDYGNAVVALRKALAAKPDDARVKARLARLEALAKRQGQGDAFDDHFGRAQLLRDMGEFSAAAVAAGKAAAADPDASAPLLLLGWLRQKLGAVDPALDAFTSAAHRDPGSIRAHIGIAAARRQQKEYDAALAAIDAALAIDPAAEGALRLRATILFEIGRDHRAIDAAFAEALAAAPEDVALWVGRAAAFASAGDWQGEADALIMAATLSKEPKAKTLNQARLANRYAEAGDMASAAMWARWAAGEAGTAFAAATSEGEINAIWNAAQKVDLKPLNNRFERVLAERAAAHWASRGCVNAGDWARRRMEFGAMASRWTWLRSLAPPDAADPWRDCIDEGAWKAFAAQSSTRPTLLIAGHIGPTVIMQHRIALHTPDVYCLSSNAAFWLSRARHDRFIYASRAGQIVVKAFAALRQNRTLFIGADGGIGKRSLPGRVFGMDTLWPSGAATLAYKTGARIFCSHAIWRGDTMAISLEPGPDPADAASEDVWLADFAAWYGAMLERLLIEDPANYRPNAYRYFSIDP